MNCYSLILFFFLLSPSLAAQQNLHINSSTSGVQYGYSLKATAEFGNKGNTFVWRVGVSGGIGAFLGAEWCYPAFNTDLLLYQGGIGSNWPGNKRKQLDIELNLSYSVTVGAQNRLKSDSYLRPGVRNYPLYYFSNFTLPVLGRIMPKRARIVVVLPAPFKPRKP